MDRYNKANGVDVAPAAPPAADHPYYTSGDPQNDIPATTPGPWLFHMLIESMRNVIVAAGLTPDHTDLNLLTNAIKSLIAGGDYKASCRVASIAAINLAAPGANIDGIAMAAGDRVLVKDQAAPAQNGLYIWNGAAVAMTRTADADVGSELNSGAIVPIEQGTVNADTNWQLITDGAITIGVTGLVFQAVGSGQFSSAAEAQAFSINNKAITPLSLAQAFQGANQSLSANGYQKLPGGFILQWGSVSFSAGVAPAATVTFPVTFPNNALFAGAIRTSVNASIVERSALSVSATTFELRDRVNGNTVSAGALNWFALGN